MKIHFNISKLFMCTALAVGGFITSFATPASAVWINEFHYDNAGTDVGEFIEIAGLAGTDLSGYTVVLYNGANGASLGTLSLSGFIIDNEVNGYGAVSIAAPGLQNGSPDGFALVNGTTVVQFLSYEGTFNAVGGPADGLPSSSVGVSELTTTPVGFSLQLTGNGASYGEFSWSGPSGASEGSVNSGQTFPAPITNAPDAGSSAFMLGLALSGLGIYARRR